jgi:iron complex transport system substrate-binding protein
MIALGLEDKLVGIEAKADARPLYVNSAPKLLNLDNVGSLKEFSPEAAVALAPDVVFLNKTLLDYKDTLEAVGVKTLMINIESQGEFQEMLRLMAAVCGKPESAEPLISYYDAEFTKAAALVAGLEDTEKPIVYMGRPESYFSTCPEGMYQAELIAKAGGVNAAREIKGDYWVNISYEQLLAMNPDIIILPTEAKYTAQDVLSDAQLSTVTAVKNGAVYHMPAGLDAWDSPGLSSVLGLKYLLAVIHPELYGMDEMRADAKLFYETFYGFTIDDGIIEIK